MAIIAGPWCSEVGYEVLYWIPFLRWVTAAYRIPSRADVAVSRGGTASWYDGIASRYVEIFDHVSNRSGCAPGAAAGALKQRRGIAISIERSSTVLRRRCSSRASTRMLHPSLMFRWFAPFWSGHETLGFVERHTRFARMTAPDVQPAGDRCPVEYAAVKLYSARSLPD